MQKKPGSSRVVTRVGGLVVAAALFGGLAGCGATTTTTSKSVATAERVEPIGDEASSADQAPTDDASSTPSTDGNTESAADVSINGLNVDVHRDPG